MSSPVTRATGERSMRLFCEDPGSPDFGRAHAFDYLARTSPEPVSERAYAAAMFALEDELAASRAGRRPQMAEVVSASVIRELNARRRKLTGGNDEAIRGRK